MAEKKFSDLTAKGAALADTDLLAISEDAGGGAYTSKSVTGANVKALVTDANLTTTDITTNDVSTSKHGFAPKAPNDTTKFLRGDGTWAAPSAGGLTKFTEAENTSAPNGTVYVDSLTAAASSTNADFAILPKGNGAILSAIPDNTATGGNKRGTNAVDLQTYRTIATQVSSGNYSNILGGYRNAATGVSSAIVGGYLNTASGDRAMILGGDNNTASGVVSFSIGGGNNATYTYSGALGYSNTSSNLGSMCLGWLNTSSGQYSFTAGQSNTASGANSTSIGYNNVSSATGANTLGVSNTANGSYSNAQGYQSHVFGIYGRQSYASGQESTAGDSQASKFVLHERTTDATATTLTTNSSAASTTNQVILSNQSAYRFKGTIIGKKSGTTDIAAWDIDGLIVRGANAAATTLAVSNVTLIQNTPVWGTPTLAADTTNGGLQVQVTGFLATNIQWTAVIETTEVIYA